ncbi:MAG: hypothetical protein F6J86_14900 [Symploca sp. SIO1B1]|nr:hypothetical protein [Symploca sp. SIO1B1]
MAGFSRWQVTQSMNGQPAFFYSDFKSLGVKISIKVDVKTRADDDFIVFSLNFQPGDTNNENANFILLNWDAQRQILTEIITSAGYSQLCRVY